MTENTDPTFQPETVLRPILTTVYLSEAGITAFLRYFAACRDPTSLYSRLSHWLGLSAAIADRRLHSYADDISEADKDELAAFRDWYQASTLPEGFHWALFDAAMYNGGTPVPPDTSETNNSPSGSMAGDGDSKDGCGGDGGNTGENGSLVEDDDDDDDDPNTEALRAALLQVDAAKRKPAPTPALTPTAGAPHKHSSFVNLTQTAGPAGPSFAGRPVAGTLLASHPEWTVQTATQIAVDKTGFLKADAGTLKSMDPDDVIRWYQLFQLTASQFGIYVVSYHEFDKGLVCYPPLGPGHVTAMNTALVLKLTQPGVLASTHPDLLLDYNHYLVREVNASLTAYNFLHAVLSQVVTTVDNRGLPVPPVFDSTDGLLDFTSKLMSFMHTFGPKAGFTPRQATIHFLAETERQGFTVTKERDELLALPVDSALPPHLGIKALFDVYKRQSMPAGTVNRTRADTAQQQQTGRDGATKPTGNGGKSKNPFYHPVPDAVCLACNRRGHKADTCITLARFATTMAFYNEHPDLSKRLAYQLKT